MKVFKAFLKTVLILAVLAVAGYYGYQYYQQQQAAKTVTATVAYTPVTIGTGSLTKSVTGTGSLSISKTHDISVSFPVVIAESLVKEGQSVKAGDPIARVDQEALKSSITTLQAEVNDLDASIASIASKHNSTTNIKPPTSGRIKRIFGKVGDMTMDVVEQYGGLMIISCDGKMNVSIPAGDLVNDQAVDVFDEQGRIAGRVASIEDGVALITFSDVRVLPDEHVTVKLGEEIIGEGNAQINMPYMVSTTVDGYISKAYYSVNNRVNKKTMLYYVTNIPADTEYAELYKQREEKLAAIDAARETLLSGYIYADMDGIVSSAESASITEFAADHPLATIFVGSAMQMKISVDELDIVSVAVGQPASIAMDAVKDHTYTAVVSYISQIGSSSGGVTNYSVTLDVEGDDLLKIGMNGTATIVVEERKGVVLVPLTALNTGRQGSYVWLQSDSAPEGMPGVQTFIETGLSSETYAEVTSGLKEGDVVLITRTAAGSSGWQGLGGMMDFGGGGMQMPGGNMQSPGGSRTNNGGGSRNRN
ncbi:MAG: HlyD family efflux transporter periplasmic adaptor subunit [Clostridia bacterium]|nr:HlyD family efflux transporter periplasmic adaptor subunit [Clostridia bacterium]